MKSLPEWCRWSSIYLVLAGVYYCANKGDPVALHVFPMLCIFRTVGLALVAFNLDSSWIQPRSTAFNLFRVSSEILIVSGLVSISAGGVAVISILGFVLYEFAHARVAYFKEN